MYVHTIRTYEHSHTQTRMNVSEIVFAFKEE